MSANAETGIMRKAKFKVQEREPKFSVSSPPGCIDKRVFVGGNYILMPILREIEKAVLDAGFQPILAYDFDMPKEKTREYTLRLLFQCKYAVLEETLSGGQIVEIVRASGFQRINILQVFMAMDERKEPPNTVSIMVWQTNPAPQGYCTIAELKELVQSFLLLY